MCKTIYKIHQPHNSNLIIKAAHRFRLTHKTSSKETISSNSKQALFKVITIFRPTRTNLGRTRTTRRVKVKVKTSSILVRGKIKFSKTQTHFKIVLKVGLKRQHSKITSSQHRLNLTNPNSLPQSIHNRANSPRLTSFLKTTTRPLHSRGPTWIRRHISTRRRCSLSSFSTMCKRTLRTCCKATKNRTSTLKSLICAITLNGLGLVKIKIIKTGIKL